MGCCYNGHRTLNRERKMCFSSRAALQILEVQSKSLLWHSPEALLNFFFFSANEFFPPLYCFSTSQAKIYLSRPKSRTFLHCNWKKDLPLLQTIRFHLNICERRRDLWKFPHAFCPHVFLRWSPPWGWTVNKATVNAAEVQRKCLCTKSFFVSPLCP